MGCRRWGVDHFLLSAPLPTTRHPISGGRGQKKRYFSTIIFFGWLTLVSFLIKCLILLCLLIYFGFDSFGNLRGILRTGNKSAFCWQPIVRFFFIFLSLNKKYFCAHPIFAFYHLPYPSLSILPPQQGQWCRDILDLHTTITGITTKMKEAKTKIKTTKLWFLTLMKSIKKW